MKKSAKEKTKRMGRPDSYKPEYCQLAIDVLSDRRPKEDLATECGVDYDTILAWSKKYPDFLGALREGTRLGKASMLKMGMDCTFSRKPFRENTFKWLMSVMYGVRDVQQIASTGSIKLETADDFSKVAENLANAAITSAKFSGT